MNILPILATMFPGATLRGSVVVEVNGLGKGTEPANCEVVGQGSQAHFGGDRRQFYLVRCEGVLFFLRICTAMEGSGYDEYAVIHRAAVTPQEQQDLETYARDYLARLR
jgi:hypothetical protein